jgi:geranylgeranyl diphosphate synthase type II
MRLGAILSGAKKFQLEKLAVFGKYLGRCFQIVDDILDLTSDFAGLKEKGNDVYEGKRTIMLGHLMRKLRGREKQNLMGILRKSRDKKTEKEVSWILGQMEEAGSIAHARTLADKFKRKALDVFERDMGFLKHEPARSHLRWLIDYIVERDH